MIDLITLVKPNLTELEIAAIVEKNSLQTNSNDGQVYYDNINTKNLVQQKGVYIRIETNRKLKLETSLHKYYNEITSNQRNNNNPFSMSQAKQSIYHLLGEKSISPNSLRVYNCEIGLNLNMAKDCRPYLDKIKSIGTIGNEKTLYVNPRYKDERVKTTIFHTHTRKYFKAYDKTFESKEKKRKIIPDGNILRIETVYRRMEKCQVIDFFDPDNLKKMIETFFRDWRTLQFEKDIITPKGTGRAKQHLCFEIINKGKETVLTQAKERHTNGTLSDWEYRNIREFITNEWDILKKEITFIQSDEEKEYRHLIKINHTLLKNDEIIN